MKEPALDPDAGHAAPNGLVLTFYHDQHLDVFGDSSMRRSMAPTEKKLRGGYCFSPALQPRFTFRGSNVVAIRKPPGKKWDSSRRSASGAARSCRAILT